MERTKEGQRRKEWSKKHGHDTYGNDDNLEAKPKVSKQVKLEKKSSGRKCKCGSTTHQRSNHRDCPLNKKNLATVPAVQNTEDLHSHDSDVEPHEEGLYYDSDEGMLYGEGFSSDESAKASSCMENDDGTPL